MGSSVSFDRRIEEQEQYVNSKFNNVKKQMNECTYSDSQIRSKLREHYYKTDKNDNYILYSTWKTVKI